MSVPFLDLAGLGFNLVGSILGQQEAKKRQRAMKGAARGMYAQQQRDFQTAWGMQQQNAEAFRTNPARAKIRGMWEKELENPFAISPADLSTMKASAMSTASANAGNAVTRLREQQQRAGVRSSPMAAGMEANVRSSAFNRNAALSTDLDLRAAQANKARGDALRSGYANWAYGDLEQEQGYNEGLIQLLASKRYDPSTLLAFM